MVERGIGVEEVQSVVNGGQTIEDYPTDTPFPSRLLLGWAGERPSTWWRRMTRKATLRW